MMDWDDRGEEENDHLEALLDQELPDNEREPIKALIQDVQTQAVAKGMLYTANLLEAALVAAKVEAGLLYFRREGDELEAELRIAMRAAMLEVLRRRREGE